MKVYLVYWCNNEKYEDYYESVEAVCSSYEKAVKFIADKGYSPHVYESDWEKLHMVDRFDSEADEWGDYCSMWVREMEVE